VRERGDPAVTSTFRLLYVFVGMEHGSRRLIHCNVTAHPTALWTRQQLREALGYETAYRYLIHDRDSIFSVELDASVGNFGLRVLKIPPRSPMANGICERPLSSRIQRRCSFRISLSRSCSPTDITGALATVIRSMGVATGK
jgi:putative transposase